MGSTAAPLSQSPEAAAADARFQSSLDALGPGVTYFNGAGNDGMFQQTLEAAGFRFDPQWSGSGQSQAEQTVSVGAAEVLREGSEVVLRPEYYSQHAPTEVTADGDNRASFEGQAVCKIDPLMGCLPEKGCPAVNFMLTTRRVAAVYRVCRLRREEAPLGLTSFAAPRVAGLFNGNPSAYRQLREQASPPVSDNPLMPEQGPFVSPLL